MATSIEGDLQDLTMDVDIQIDSFTNLPKKAWERIRVKSKHRSIPKSERLDPCTPITPDNIRFVCISDTHSKLEMRDTDFIPPGDVLLHAGDFTMKGDPEAVHCFNAYLGKLPHKHKVVIAGNHEVTFDEAIISKEFIDPMLGNKRKIMSQMETFGVKSVKDLLTNCIYLEDDMVNLYGINIYGSPWQPSFAGWGFNLPRGEELLEIWNTIPKNTDILMTHGPPVGHGDTLAGGNNVGCVELLNTVQKRVKPRYHVFGHIHEGYGVTTNDVTTFINASTCTTKYRPINPPIVFDYPVPAGHTKDEHPIMVALEKSVKTRVRAKMKHSAKSKLRGLFSASKKRD